MKIEPQSTLRITENIMQRCRCEALRSTAEQPEAIPDGFASIIFATFYDINCSYLWGSYRAMSDSVVLNNFIL
jgi:hypothetical protein